MQISVILAHPNKKSFNYAIATAVVETMEQLGHDIFFHDLYAEQFDALLPYAEFFKDTDLPVEIHRHCDEISSADGIVVVHPNWWGQPPAILKGWVDRVLRPGVAYEFLDGDKGEGVPIGLLKAQVALVFNTSNTQAEREANVFGDPLETLWKNCIFEFCGVKDFYRKMYRVMVVSSQEQREAWLEDVRQVVAHYFAER